MKALKPHLLAGDGLLCVETILPENNKRIHVEIDKKEETLHNAWDPERVCYKKGCHVEDKPYATYNDKSNRYHRTDTPRRGQFARGTKGEPSGLVTEDKNRSQWKNHRTGSPHPDPFTGSPSRRSGAGQDDGSSEGPGHGNDRNGSEFQSVTNARGEHVEITRKPCQDGLEKIDYKATKTTKDGTTTTTYKNESRADAPIGHSKFFEVDAWV